MVSLALDDDLGLPNKEEDLDLVGVADVGVNVVEGFTLELAVVTMDENGLSDEVDADLLETIGESWNEFKGEDEYGGVFNMFDVSMLSPRLLEVTEDDLREDFRGKSEPRKGIETGEDPVFERESFFDEG